MSEEATGVETLVVPLTSLLLDPNSVRLIDDPFWRPIPDDEIGTPPTQLLTAERLLEHRTAGISELVESIRQLGWLEVEPLRVRALKDGSLVVVDGNRRVLALRVYNGMSSPRQLSLAHSSLGHPAEAQMSLRVTLERGLSQRDLELAQGLRHMNPPSPWSGFSAAAWQWHANSRFENWPKRLPQRRLVRPEADERALNLCKLYRQSRWGEQFRPELFLLFREAVSFRALRNWLRIPDLPSGDDTLVSALSVNLERFFSWISVTDDLGKAKGQPALRTPSDLRRLASVINEPSMLQQLDLGRSLDAAFEVPPGWFRDEFGFDSFRLSLEKFLREKPKSLTQETIESAQATVGVLRRLIESKGEEPVAPSSEQPWPIASHEGTPNFSSVRIQHHRGLADVSLAGLGKVNLLVGVNNAGKTSVLEAIYLLCRLADPRGLLDTIRARLRSDPEARPEWLVRNLLPRSSTASAKIASGAVIRVGLTVSDVPATKELNLATFLATLTIRADGPTAKQISTTEFITGRPRRTLMREGTRAWLSPAVFHSPFSLADRLIMEGAYEKSIEAGTKGEVISFIREHIDAGVIDIELVNANGRFVVQHENERSLDLCSYGEGMQRVFQLGLLFAVHAGGVLLIDEFENALHTSVLVDFSRMIQRLARRFDVQVFLTTHSKETIDAFLMNDYHVEDIVAYLLTRTGAKTSVRRFDGASLKRAVEIGDVDLRRL